MIPTQEQVEALSRMQKPLRPAELANTASFGALASMLRSMSHNFRCESSASVRNIKPVDCGMLAELFDEIANRLDELVSVVSRREEGGAK